VSQRRQTQPVQIVAEIGNNHEGSLDAARRLVELAAGCGADAVKFQTFRPAHYVSAANAERYARLQRFELSPAAFAELAELARSLGLQFISTPFDLGSADVLEPIVDAFKIASGDNTFYPLLERVAGSPKPLILSVGLLDLEGVRASLQFIRDRRPAGAGDITVLHCVSAYPVPPAEANLQAIATLARELGCAVGYSDHTVGADAAPLAVALGATLIEKHFTLDKQYSDFRDHQLSADPDELREIVRRVRIASEMLGSGNKALQASEAASQEQMRRSIVAAGEFPAGHVLTLADLTWVRPGGGLAPGQESQLVGRALVKPVRFGDRLTVADVGAPAR
jgi:sialic acid synthase SpsE